MSNVTLIKQPTNLAILDFNLVHEDAAKEGFNNLGFGANSFVMNPRFQFGTDFKINGQSGNDVISTSIGDDTVYGGSGNDTISTGGGVDYLYGGSGDDKLYAGSEGDIVHGGSGKDTIDGGSGTDSLYGGTGDDTITGGYDDDMLRGEDGNDLLSGGQGNDQLHGGVGNDTMTGDVGADRFFINLREGVDTITDFTRGQDDIILSYEIRSQFPETYLDGHFNISGRIFNENVPVPGSSGLTLSSGPLGYEAVIIFDAATQMLSFDADGLMGAGARIDLVRLTGITHVEAGDFQM